MFRVSNPVLLYLTAATMISFVQGKGSSSSTKNILLSQSQNSISVGLSLISSSYNQSFHVVRSIPCLAKNICPV